MPSKYSVQGANILPGLQFAAGGVRNRVDFERGEVKKKQDTLKRDEAVRIVQTGTPEDIAAYVAKNPEAKQVYADMLEIKNSQALDSSVNWLINNQGDPQKGFDIFAKDAETDIQSGADATENMEMSKSILQDPETAKKVAEMTIAMLGTPQMWKNYTSQKTGGIGSSKVRSTQKYKNGASIQYTDQGPIVRDPAGKIMSGDEAKATIEEANAYETKLGGERIEVIEEKKFEKGYEWAGKAAAKEQQSKDAAISVNDMFTKIEAIDSNLLNLEEGIRLIDSGADTGVLDQFLPTFKESTQNLKALQNELGLDVLKAVTFGALSAKELEFALSTAMPGNMQPKSLKRWFIRKKDKQQKLKNYLEEASSYLSVPGNTKAMWIKEQKARKKQKGKQKTNTVIIRNHPTHGDITESDIQASMQGSGMTRSEVLKRLSAGGQ